MAGTRRKKQERTTPTRAVKGSVADLPKLSDALMDFAQPILDAIPEPTAEFVRAALTLAKAAWNLPVLEDRGEAGELAQVRQDLECTLAAAPPAAAALLERMMEERRLLLPKDTRIITDFKVKFQGNELIVTAYGTLLPALNSN